MRQIRVFLGLIILTMLLVPSKSYALSDTDLTNPSAKLYTDEEIDWIKSEVEAHNQKAQQLWDESMDRIYSPDEELQRNIYMPMSVYYRMGTADSYKYNPNTMSTNKYRYVCTFDVNSDNIIIRIHSMNVVRLTGLSANLLDAQYRMLDLGSTVAYNTAIVLEFKTYSGDSRYITYHDYVEFRFTGSGIVY